MFSSNEMIDDVRSGGITSPIAKPLFTNIAHNNTTWIMNSTVFTSIKWQFLKQSLKLNKQQI